MRNIHCNVIRDLLPLYADDVVSEQSRELVEDHLAFCPDCRQILGEIRTELPIPQQTDAAPLKKLKKKQRIRGVCIALIAALCAALLLAYPVALMYANSMDQIGAEYGPECFIVTEYPGGRVELTLTEEAQGACIYYLYEINEDDSTDLYLYIYGKDPLPLWLRRFSSPFPLFSEGYPLYQIGPKYNFDSGNRYDSYDMVGGLILDETITEVYYQSITAEEQRDFCGHYLRAGYLIGYDAPEKEDCTLIWSRTK